MGRAFDGLPIKIHNPNAIPGKQGDVTVGKKEDLAGMLQQRGNVASDKILALADPDHRRRSVSRGNQFLRILGGQEDQRVDAPQVF